MPEPRLNTSRWWTYEDALLILLLAALLYLPGLGATSLFDRDEPRFASAGRHMLQTGNFIVPYFNGDLRPDKPPLIYWLMSASYHLLGGFTELAARLPSAICSALTLLVVYAAAGSRFGRVTGIVAALLLGSSVMFVIEARLATADAAMILFTTLAFACAWRAWDAAAPRNAPGYLPKSHTLPATDDEPALELVPAAVKTGPVPFPIALLFWISLAVAVLAKGVPLLFVLLPMLTLSIATAPVWADWRRYSWTQRLMHLPQAFARAIIFGNWRWWTGLRPFLGITFILLPIVIFAFSFLVNFAAFGVHGILAKRSILCLLYCGPLVYPVASVVLAWRRYTWPALLLDLLIVLLYWISVVIVVGWVFAVVALTDGELLRRMFQQQHDRVLSTGTVTTYKQPPGFYLLLIWGTFWPWTPLLVPAAYHTLKRMLGKTALVIDPRPYQFLVAWIVPSWIVYEFIPSKLPHYTLPMYIPLAILCADTLVQSWSSLTDVLAAKWLRSARWGFLGIWLTLAAGLAGFTYYIVGGEAHEVFWRAIPALGAFVATGTIAAWVWNRPAFPFVTALGWAMCLALLNATVLPEIPALRVSKDIMRDARDLERRGYVVAAANYNEPTLVFYADAAPDRPFPLYPDAAKIPDLPAIFDDAPKHASPGQHFGSPDAPTALITDARGLEQLSAAGAKFTIWSSAAGFRTDSVDWLRQSFASALGKPAKPAKQFVVYLVVNQDPRGRKTPATTRAATTTTSAPATSATAPATTSAPANP